MRRSFTLGSLAFSALAVVASVACSTTAGEDTLGTSTGALGDAFEASAQAGAVPRDLLVAIAKVEQGLELPALRPDLDVDNEVPAAGPLQLRRGKLDTLARGAALVGASEVELRIDADLALRAGALVLAEIGAKTGARADDLASFREAIEEMSGFADDANREHYTHQVFATLARGGRFEGRDGELITLKAHPEIPPTLTLDVSDKVHMLAGAEYPGAQYFPTSCTNKCTTNRGGNKVDKIVIHDTEGGWNASVATLQNDPGKSVQYIIDVDGKVGQFIPESYTGYHGGNYFYNQTSIGIEHVGYSTKPYPEALYVSSAKLTNHLVTKYGVKKDRAHIIGHDQIPNGTKLGQTAPPCMKSPRGCRDDLNYGGAGHHTDPGIWEWAVFMSRFGAKAKCNDVTNLWNCSNDKKHAFRCLNGNVEVNECSSCTVMANGVDDVCQVKSAPAPAPDAGPADGGASDAEAPVDPGTPPPTSDETSSSELRPKAPTNDSSAEIDDGCSASPSGPRGGASTGVLAMIGLALVGIRRRATRAR